MIRKLLTIGILALLVGGVVYLLFLSPKPHQSEDARTRAIVEWAVQTTLRPVADFDIQYLVVGAEIETGVWEFRGMVTRNSGDALTVGSIQRLCNRTRRSEECWELIDLKLDGKAWRTTPDERDKVATIPAPTPTATPAPETQPTQPLSTQQPATPAPQAAASSEPEPVVEEIEIWRTSRSVVNARKGPGTTFPIVTRITPSFALTLVSKEAGWGQFEIIEPDRMQGQIIWVWMDLIDKVEG